MPLFRHKGHHGGRYDDPHGVTKPAPVSNKESVYDAVRRGDARPYVKPDGTTGYKVTIDTEAAPSKWVLPEKEQRRKDKAMKKINKPKERAESQRRGLVYDRARADEERRLDTYGQNTLKEGKDGRITKVAKGGVAGAYIEGGFKGVEKYDKKTYGKKSRPEQIKALDEKEAHEEKRKQGEYHKDVRI
jgi:hypothetical protein